MLWKVFVYLTTHKPDHWIQFFLIAMPWVACPGYGSSLTVQEHEKQSVLRLTQIRFEGFEKIFPTGKTLQKHF